MGIGLRDNREVAIELRVETSERNVFPEQVSIAERYKVRLALASDYHL